MRNLCVIVGAWLIAQSVVLPAVGAERADAIAAIVNDKIITAREVEMQSEQSLIGLRRMASRQAMDAQTLQQKYDALMEEGLQQLIEKELILFEYKTGNLKLPERVIDDEIESTIKKQFGDRMRLMQSLKAEGMTFDTWRQQRYDKLIVDVMSRRNISQAILISPTKIEQFYLTNQTRFQLEDQVKLRISWAALDLGRVRARIAAAKAQADAELANYERTVLNALEETANALEFYGQEQARQEYLRVSNLAATDAVNLAKQRYEGGIVDYLTVLDAQRTQLIVQDQLAQSETRTATALVSVYKALGGGWEIETQNAK